MTSGVGTKGVPRAQRETQLLDVAAAEIARVGYAGLAPATVAAAAGVSKPLVYNYFGSKDGLYIACVRRAAAVLDTAIDEVIGGEPTPGMAQRTLAAIFTALQPRPHDWSVVFDRSHPDDGPAADAARAARARIAGQAAHGVSAVLTERGVDDPDDQSALTAAWMGAVSALVAWWLRHPEQTAAQMIARSARLLDALS